MNDKKLIKTIEGLKNNTISKIECILENMKDNKTTIHEGIENIVDIEERIEDTHIMITRLYELDLINFKTWVECVDIITETKSDIYLSKKNY